MSPAAIEVRIVGIEPIAVGVLGVRLRAADGAGLPRFSAGSHVVVSAEGAGRPFRNAYSLIGDGDNQGLPVEAYDIAVALRPDSRGGSRWFHEQAAAGARLEIGWPCNLFPLASHARRHLLVAGGIGVTPVLAMARRLMRSGAGFEVHYGYRSTGHAALLQPLREIAGARLREHDGSRGQRVDFARLLPRQPLGTHVYVCGPAGMIDDCRRAARAAGWPDAAVHFERFSVRTPGEPFVARLQRSGLAVPVGRFDTLLEAIEQAGVRVESMCRGGVCGACRTGVLRGELLHADDFLDDAERAAGDCLMPCVSRARGEVVLDL